MRQSNIGVAAVECWIVLQPRLVAAHPKVGVVNVDLPLSEFVALLHPTDLEGLVTL